MASRRAPNWARLISNRKPVPRDGRRRFIFMNDIITAATHPASQNENVAVNNEPRRDAAFGGDAEATANVVAFHRPDDAATNPIEQDGEAVATAAGEHPEIADDDLDDGETLERICVALNQEC